MLQHDTWGRRSTNKRREKEKSRVPLHDTHQAVHFFLAFYILGEGGEIEGNNMRKMKELCPNTTHGEEEAQTKERNRIEPCPPPRHTNLYIFLFFF